MVELKTTIIGGICMGAKKGQKRFGDAIINEVLKMKSEGRSNREISEHFGLAGPKVIKQLYNRYNRKQRQMAEGILPRKIGRPRKRQFDSEIDKDNIIQQLRMENELLRSFLSEAGRR